MKSWQRMLAIFDAWIAIKNAKLSHVERFLKFAIVDE